MLTLADPIMELTTNINSAFNDMNRGLSQIFSTGMKSLNEMAPHNVLPKMAPPSVGAGMFSRKMTTQQLNETNIFGG